VADCVFCIGPLAGNHSTPIIAEWPDTIAIEPLDPVTPGHLLVIPRVHVEDALTDGIVTGYVHQRAAELAGDLVAGAAIGFFEYLWEAVWNDVGGVNIITSCGPAATQTVMHLHVHVVPRRLGDRLALPWTREDE
jgi:histidine triad (HIT) family protein